MTNPFEITIENTVYFVFPDWDDFIDRMIYGIERSKQEIGILLFNEANSWEWIEGGIDALPANLLGEQIELKI